MNKLNIINNITYQLIINHSCPNINTKTMLAVDIPRKVGIFMTVVVIIMEVECPILRVSTLICVEYSTMKEWIDSYSFC